MSVRSTRPQIVSALLLLTFLPMTSTSQDGPRRGTKAPAFELPSVKGIKIALREFENKKVVIVHFWKSK